MIGIYKITNDVNGRIYVGKSVNISRRWNEHTKLLVSNRRHSSKLQADFNKFGIECFSFKVVCLCDKCDLSDLEEKYIAKYDALEVGYNVAGLNQSYDANRRMSDLKKFVIDIEKLVNDVDDPAVIARFVALYVGIMSIGNKISSNLGIKKKSSLAKYLNVRPSLRVKILNDFYRYNLIIDDTNEPCGFRVNGDYIKKVYILKEDDSDKFIICKDKYTELYRSLPPHKHNVIGRLIKMYKLFDNKECSCNVSEARSHESLISMCSGEHNAKFFSRLMSASTEHCDLIHIEDSKLYINPGLYQPYKAIGNVENLKEMFYETGDGE